MSSLHQQKQAIIEVGRRIHQKGFVASNDGNISVRLGADRVLATPSGFSKGFLTPEQLVITNMDGKKVAGTLNPSSEIKVHLMVYRERPDVKAVVHAHPPTATGFAVAGIALTRCVLPEVVVALGSIPLAPYALPSTEELSESIKEYIQKHDAILMENHGAITIGSDLFNAYYKMETLEHFAKIEFVARQLGNVELFSASQAEDLIRLREKFGLPGPSPGCTTVEGGKEVWVKPNPPSTGSTTPVATDGQERANEREALIDRITREVIEQLRERG